MVRTGVVSHPSEWPFGGYNEIQNPRRKCVLIGDQNAYYWDMNHGNSIT